MRFDLDGGGFDSRGFIEGPQRVEGDIGKSDGPAPAAIYERFERTPGVEQSYFAVVNHISVFIAGILLVSGLKGEGSVNEIEIEIGEAEPFEAGLEGRFDALGAVIGIPQFGGDENIFAG